MSNGIAVQHNTLSDIQIVNMRGFMQESPIIDVLFWIFIICIILYFIWNKRNKQ